MLFDKSKRKSLILDLESKLRRAVGVSGVLGFWCFGVLVFWCRVIFKTKIIIMLFDHYTTFMISTKFSE